MHTRTKQRLVEREKVEGGTTKSGLRMLCTIEAPTSMEESATAYDSSIDGDLMISPFFPATAPPPPRDHSVPLPAAFIHAIATSNS